MNNEYIPPNNNRIADEYENREDAYSFHNTPPGSIHEYEDKEDEDEEEGEDEEYNIDEEKEEDTQNGLLSHIFRFDMNGRTILNSLNMVQDMDIIERYLPQLIIPDNVLDYSANGNEDVRNLLLSGYSQIMLNHEWIDIEGYDVYDIDHVIDRLYVILQNAAMTFSDVSINQLHYARIMLMICSLLCALNILLDYMPLLNLEPSTLELCKVLFAHLITFTRWSERFGPIVEVSPPYRSEGYLDMYNTFYNYIKRKETLSYLVREVLTIINIPLPGGLRKEVVNYLVLNKYLFFYVCGLVRHLRI